MSFENHVFISYAHIDNQPLSEEQKGWISRFHESLQSFLSMRLGGEAHIWRDEKLTGNDVFDQEILDQFPKTAIFISILTPRYVNSEWCTREVKEFCTSAEETGGVIVGNKSRVFKVVKFPPGTQEALPEIMGKALGYNFYILDEREHPLELDPLYGDEYEHAYYRKLSSVAYDLARAIETVEGKAVQNGREAGIDLEKPTVYLAECSHDMMDKLEILSSELKALGYPILPDQNLPRFEDEYLAEVDHLLARCALSIHLIGETYGLVPDGPGQQSGIVLQNECAIQRSIQGGLRRLIWIPEDLKPVVEIQAQFIESLQKDARMQLGADLISSSFEVFKTAVHETLRQIETPGPEPSDASESGNVSQIVYVICDGQDRKATIPLRKFLMDRGYIVKTPLFEGDAATIRKAHEEYIKLCDATILFYGAGNETWRYTKESELKKMWGYRGEKPLLARYMYLSGPKTQDKTELIELEYAHVIDGLEGFEESQMVSFTETLDRAEPERSD